MTCSVNDCFLKSRTLQLSDELSPMLAELKEWMKKTDSKFLNKTFLYNYFHVDRLPLKTIPNGWITRFYLVAHYLDFWTFQRLLKETTAFKVVAVDKSSTLHAIVSGGSRDVETALLKMKFLVQQYRFNVNVKDCLGRTALYYVDHPKFVDELVALGATTYMTDCFRLSPALHQAKRAAEHGVFEKSTDLLRKFIPFGCENMVHIFEEQNCPKLVALAVEKCVNLPRKEKLRWFVQLKVLFTSTNDVDYWIKDLPEFDLGKDPIKFFDDYLRTSPYFKLRLCFLYSVCKGNGFFYDKKPPTLQMRQNCAKLFLDVLWSHRFYYANVLKQLIFVSEDQLAILLRAMLELKERDLTAEMCRRCIRFKNDDGQTLLHYVCGGNVKGVVNERRYKALREKLFDLKGNNVKDNSGKTPLHYAAEYSDARTCYWLLLYGADIYSKDNRDRVANLNPLMSSNVNERDVRLLKQLVYAKTRKLK